MSFVGFIDSVLDSFIISEAAKRGEIKMMTKRPMVIRNSPIEDGMTVIFDETMTGMKRWTDGRVWAPSKLYNGFFLYEEKREDKNESDDYLFKKVISVITPDEHIVHVINYFYSNTNKAPFNKTGLKRPFECNFRDMESIIQTAKRYQYYKCFRTKSRAWRKLYYAPEVESKIEFRDERVMTHTSEPTPKSFSFIPTLLGNNNEHNSIDRMDLPPVSNLFVHSDTSFTSDHTNHALPRHSETNRQITLLNRFSYL